MWQGLGLFLIHFFIVLIVLSSLACLVGLLSKNDLLTMGLLVLGYYGYTLLIDLPFMAQVKWFIPLTYLNSFEVLTQSPFPSIYRSFLASVTILSIFNVIIMLINRYLIRRI